MTKPLLLAGMAILSISVAAPPAPNFQHHMESYYININENGNRPIGPLPLYPKAIPNTYIAKYDATWFGEISRIFARNTDAVIRDITTGRIFNMRRTFGTNHADVEPLTREDAAIMYDIWGGHSWERRAVVVYVGNYVFAGSLTNFPHAGVDNAPSLATVNNRSGGYGRGLNFDAVKGNGVDGHMCLHFAGSLIHGSNRSNAAHQQRVAEAVEYIKANY
ncbi:MAG: hypothetical protein FWC93_01785 [Defluviitaleaceae bacterium]|nr:hypothetical protein [Defluviitaleaceae bacterium]